MKIAFVYNLRNNRSEAQAEWDSPDTVDAISNALSRRGDLIQIDAGLAAAEETIRTCAPDIVFNYAEGFCGEAREAEIPAMCELLGVPYTGSGPATMTNCLNKAKAKKIMGEAGIPTAPFKVLNNTDENIEGLNFPCIVKPLWEGSSKGIHDGAMAENLQRATELAAIVIKEYSQPALVEEFLPGDEFTVGILGNAESARVLPIAAVNLSALPGKFNPILSYEAKWIVDTPENPLPILTCPGRMDSKLQAGLENMALGAFKALDCRDWCRIDIRLDSNGNPNVLELNPIPGLLPRPEDNSCLPAAARAAGISYEELVLSVLDAALKRLGMGESP